MSKWRDIREDQQSTPRQRGYALGVTADREAFHELLRAMTFTELSGVLATFKAAADRLQLRRVPTPQVTATTDPSSEICGDVLEV